MPEELETLSMWKSSGKTEHRLDLRARVFLEAANGLSLREINEMIGLGWSSCQKWRKRFQERGIDDLKDRLGRGRPETINQEQRLEVMALACTEPVDGSNALV